MIKEIYQKSLAFKNEAETIFGFKKSEKHHFAIIVATQLELDAILDVLDSHKVITDQNEDSSIYYSGVIDNKKIIVTKTPFTGISAASCTCTKLMIRFYPKVIFMGGIAAGNKDSTRIGDILIAEKSIDYNQVVEIERKDGTKDKKNMTKDLIIDGHLKTKLEKFISTKPTNTIHETYSQKDKFEKNLKCHFGTLVTGSALIRSDEKIEEISKLFHGVIGLDMETYGIYYSASNTFRDFKPKFLSIKSVSDFGGKNDPHEPLSLTERQSYATYTSSNFIKLFIKKEY